MINQPVIIPEQRLCFSQKQAFSTLLFNGSNRCEVAKLAFCSEDVKTAALPPCEVAPDGGGCVKITDCSKKSAFPTLRPTGAIDVKLQNFVLQ